MQLSTVNTIAYLAAVAGHAVATANSTSESIDVEVLNRSSLTRALAPMPPTPTTFAKLDKRIEALGPAPPEEVHWALPDTDPALDELQPIFDAGGLPYSLRDQDGGCRGKACCRVVHLENNTEHGLSYRHADIHCKQLVSTQWVHSLLLHSSLLSAKKVVMFASRSQTEGAMDGFTG